MIQELFVLCWVLLDDVSLWILLYYMSYNVIRKYQMIEVFSTYVEYNYTFINNYTFIDLQIPEELFIFKMCVLILVRRLKFSPSTNF